MEFGVGSVLEGKVSSITKFGAFVTLPDGRSGLVHISEVAHSYVNDIREHLTEGKPVKVKVIGIDENNRINLSIKKAIDPPPRPAGRPGGFKPAGQGGSGGFRPNGGQSGGYRPSGGPGGPRPAGRPNFGSRPTAPKEPATFEDRLKQFMADSDSRQSDLNRNNEKRSSRRGGHKGN